MVCLVTANSKILEALEWYAHMGIDLLPKATIMQEKNTSLSLGSLDNLYDRIAAFDKCALKKTAKHTVFADGAKDAKIMLIGEAPGATEDEMGIPFCGESGKLLDRILESIGLSRLTNVYITNTVFWRPPANRRPTDEEIELCRPFVEEHIAIINPKLLVLVGSTAVESLLGKHLQISKIRQEYYSYSNKFLQEPITTTAIFHPAYLLRQPAQKKASWYDMLKIREHLDKLKTL
jgi:uracil-DNA glycosylase family 4